MDFFLDDKSIMVVTEFDDDLFHFSHMYYIVYTDRKQLNEHGLADFLCHRGNLVDTTSASFIALYTRDRKFTYSPKRILSLTWRTLTLFINRKITNRNNITKKCGEKKLIIRKKFSPD